ncbi:pyridoxine biosynthesis protein PDX2 [Plasmodium brasilianum]|uniref:glutaminase n=3 Tax=Plasmodium (Plasmodium) TaxID=418103 RepID=A0A1D3PBL9_PLAMA|nr:pyridoxine biosynthesis protein PDX2, putative [Plasmodium malariae]KAI4838287.1 pyridoxine biosynthesis protein PDX2 [Plasmodium brasilianum]SCN12682.1 pyridoxine biosynthesis protein PDX2, putative [Plasmodium malariae]
MEETTIGVLSLQGDFQPHIKHFLKLEEPSLKIKEVRDKSDLSLCDGLVIPGGESTTLRKCFSYDNDSLYNALKNFIHVEKKPTWGTCAGCILLSKNVENNEMYNAYGNNFSLGGLDITISRNYYGSQNDSFICSLNINSQNSVFKKNLRAACIRAPYIKGILSDNVETLATFSHEPYGTNIIAAVEQNNCIGTVFHPELMPYICFHQYFFEKVKYNKKHLK